MFTPVLNKYFLSSLAVTACLFGAAALCKKFGKQKQTLAPHLYLVILLVGIATLWFVMSVETETFFRARAAMLKSAEAASHEGWLGQLIYVVLALSSLALALILTSLVRTTLRNAPDPNAKTSSG